MRSPITQELFPIMTLEEVYATKYENSQSLEQILAGKDTSNGLIVWIDNRKECLGEYTVEQVISNALKSAGFTKAVPLYQFEITDVFYLTGPEGI